MYTHKHAGFEVLSQGNKKPTLKFETNHVEKIGKIYKNQPCMQNL
jgi:hypothetical protein